MWEARRARDTDNKQECDWVTCLKFCGETVATVTGKVAGSCGRCYHDNHPPWPSDAERKNIEERAIEMCVYGLDGNKRDRWRERQASWSHTTHRSVTFVCSRPLGFFAACEWHAGPTGPSISCLSHCSLTEHLIIINSGPDIPAGQHSVWETWNKVILSAWLCSHMGFEWPCCAHLSPTASSLTSPWDLKSSLFPLWWLHTHIVKVTYTFNRNTLSWITNKNCYCFWLYGHT